MPATKMLRRVSVLAASVLIVVPGVWAQGRGMPGRTPETMPGETMPGMSGRMDMGGVMPMMGHGMMDGGMMGPGMMDMMGQGMGMMTTGGPGPPMILGMADALSLTAQQRTQLRAIQNEYSSTVQPLMAEVMQAHQDAAAALEGDSPDLTTYERALRVATDRIVEAHVAMARAASGAREVLTEAQRQQLQDAVRAMQGMMRQGRPGVTPP